MFGVFSENQAKLIGIVEWTVPETDQTVFCTEVGEIRGIPSCKHEDKKDCGPVGRFVRRVSYGSLKSLSLDEPPQPVYRQAILKEKIFRRF